MECSRCAAALAPGALVCSSCHALVHAEKLEQLAASARLHEEAHEIAKARSDWSSALALLPPESAQAEWIRGNTKRLDALALAAPTANARHGWARKLGPFAPLAILLAKGKFLLTLFKLKSLLSLGTFVAVYWALYGIQFAIGFAVLILVHEMGHYIDIRRRGLPADMPVFLPGLGAYVRWAALGVSVRTRALVSLAGPLAVSRQHRRGRVRVAVGKDRPIILDRSREPFCPAERAEPDSGLGTGWGTGGRRARQDRTRHSVGRGGAVCNLFSPAGVSAGRSRRGLSRVRQGHSGGTLPLGDSLLPARAGIARFSHPAGAPRIALALAHLRRRLLRHEENYMNTKPPVPAPSLTVAARVLQFPLTRIVLALLIIAIPFAAVNILLRFYVTNRPLRILGYFILAAVVMVAYRAYVRTIEKRDTTELSRPKLLRELGIGVLLGAVLFSLTIGVLAASGAYQVSGNNGWYAALAAVPGCTLAAVLEEITVRGVVFRILEQWLGSWIALALSAILFGLLHLIDPGASLLSTGAIMLEAGILLAAAYMLTRRLWLCMGLHFAWNFTQGGIFSAAISGGATHGLLKATLVGPVWLTGGAFGPEASVVAVVVCTTAGLLLLVAAYRKGHVIRSPWAVTPAAAP
jgi:uncharacterized protein